MDPQVKDLIQSLLKRNPLERLGAGPVGILLDNVYVYDM